MRAIVSAALLAIAGNSAAAADGASLNIIGYSPDTRYFAFEQFGYQDGSGFPYWEVFVVDLEKNAWVAGSPIHAVIEDESSRLPEARAKAMAGANSVLQTFRITVPADTLAANAATEVLADRDRITFDRWYRSMGAMPETNGSADEIRYDLAVEETPAAQPANCPAEDGPFTGFTLRLRGYQTGIWRTLHADETIPESRRCPIGYDLRAVAASSGYPENDRLVAIVGVYSRGFEGADHRFIAVPFTLK